MSKSKYEWIPCTERMPEIKIDYLGNCVSPKVLLLLNSEYFKACVGYLNPLGIFETYQDGCPEFVGRPNEEVIAWFPFPNTNKLEL